MASKRTIKRDVNNMVFDIVDECFMFLINDGSKTEAAEAIIDSAADFQEEILSKIIHIKTWFFVPATVLVTLIPL